MGRVGLDDQSNQYLSFCVPVNGQDASQPPSYQVGGTSSLPTVGRAHVLTHRSVRCCGRSDEVSELIDRSDVVQAGEQAALSCVPSDKLWGRPIRYPARWH